MHSRGDESLRLVAGDYSKDLIGVWKNEKDGDGSVLLNLRDDGTFIRRERLGEWNLKIGGIYRVEDGEMRFVYDCQTSGRYRPVGHGRLRKDSIQIRRYCACDESGYEGSRAIPAYSLSSSTRTTIAVQLSLPPATIAVFTNFQTASLGA